MRRLLPIGLVLAAASPALALDTHTIHLSVETPASVSVDAVMTDLTFQAVVPGMSMDGQTATGVAQVAYTSSGESALMVEIDSDPGLAGFDLSARPTGSDCGAPLEVSISPSPQPLIELSGSGSCAETVQVEYVGTVIDASAVQGSFIGVVTYTLL